MIGKLGRTAALAWAVAALPAAAGAQTQPTLANAAAKNCVAKGGVSKIEKTSVGSEFGVCYFDDNRQCEEWALLRGECKAGGIKVTGYVTPAARYCAITGGAYRVMSASNQPDEKGTCTFPTGKSCDADLYFSGSCTRDTSTASTPAPTSSVLPKTVHARFSCAGSKSIDVTFINDAKSLVNLKLSDGRAVSLPQSVSADGARYASSGDAVVFWNVGSTAFLEEGGKRTFDGCKALR